MTRQEAIQEACAIVSMAYSAKRDYAHAEDCFCGENPIATMSQRNEGRALNYVREAVRAALIRDGFRETLEADGVFIPEQSA